MKVVILAAGRGKRMGDLTKNTPKPLLKISQKTLLDNKLEIIPKNTSEIIIVIGYLGDKIQKYVGNSYAGIPVTYIEQNKLLGTADALYLCKNILNQSFVVMMSDDMYSKEDINKLYNLPNDKWVMIFSKSEPEKSSIYTGMCKITPEIFTKDPVKINGGEFGLPQTIELFKNEREIRKIYTEKWKRVSSPEDLKTFSLSDK